MDTRDEASGRDRAESGSACEKSGGHGREEEDLLLGEINAELPRGIDWKFGARDYPQRHEAEEGSWSRRYHLIKPFCGGPDFSPFFEEMYRFLNFMGRLELRPRSRILDVGCGPGWVSHLAAKLGHSVVGIDISPDFIAIARERVERDPYPPYVGEPLRAEFLVHDIEKAPLPGGDRFDLVVFESSLHHFLDPISAVRNAALGLAPSGSLVILDPCAPAKGSPEWRKNLELMRRYATLERPLSRSQLERLLRLVGFTEVRFFVPVNGFFPEGTGPVEIERTVEEAQGHFNYCFARFTASPGPTGFDPRLRMGRGFFPPEHDESGFFCWAGPVALMEALEDCEPLLEISSPIPELRGREQEILILVGGEARARLSLARGASSGRVSLSLHRGAAVRLVSQEVFIPAAAGGSDDWRALSFAVRSIADHETGG